MTMIAEYGSILVILACVLGLFVAWGVGANDVANAMGTSVGSKSITLRQAIVIAVIFEFLGAWLAGGQVTETIRSGIVDPALLNGDTDLYVIGMLGALLSTGIWLVIASTRGWPVSTTHTLVGAIMGFGVVGVGVHSVNWGLLSGIFLSWIGAPAIAGVSAFLLFKSVQFLILERDRPLESAQRYVPIYMFLVGFMIAMVVVFKALKSVLALDALSGLLVSLVLGVLVALIGKLVLYRMVFRKSSEDRFDFSSVERIFGVLMMFTACAMAFAHGSNDVSNAVGPMVAIIDMVATGGDIAAATEVPDWVLVLGGVGIVLGLVTYGHKVIATVGSGITELTPSRGFAATLATAGTVVLGSVSGLPLSTTQTLIGAILGVGLARGMAALNLGVLGSIAISWLITLPAGAAMSIVFFFTFKGIFT
ncbi:inorganic phosphate transporter [Halotalea alkalilenta]|uniref:Phosphate transporter n=1 Tax=Halotalea alkalilenta TaxID=376489 RepID=A0A172YD94_9GAMM|nr:inorganic phosphate transporter [Halotalea alkalilenta]ANF57229.1 phosphate permease [Halotalea alkalilenta]